MIPIASTELHFCVSVFITQTGSLVLILVILLLILTVGNTPAKLLTAHIPVYQPVAKILLLGCGDPRHILYTTWCHQQAGELSNDQILSVTTCDIEPSTIARNILLYRLILDSIDIQIAWCIFYDRIIDDVCMAAVVESASKLYKSAETLKEWHNTSFGSYIKFCDEGTFKIVRRIWAVYAKGRVSKEAEDRMNENELRKKYLLPEGCVVLTSATLAMPCSWQALMNKEVHIEMFRKYASTGRSPHSTYASRSLLTTPNPTMYRGEGQIADLHYGLDPVCNFHVAEAYANLQYDPTMTIIRRKTNKETTAVAVTAVSSVSSSLSSSSISDTTTATTTAAAVTTTTKTRTRTTATAAITINPNTGRMVAKKITKKSSSSSKSSAILNGNHHNENNNNNENGNTNNSNRSNGNNNENGIENDGDDDVVDDEVIYSVCLSQFSRWCLAFKRAITEKKLIIRSFSGDMFDLSQSMVYTKSNPKISSVYGMIGSLRQGNIVLQEDVPLEYDMIDTSNVSDHCGLLNVLLACRELLCEGINSVIATQIASTLSKSAGDKDLLSTEIRTDIHTFAAVTGLCLLDSSSQVTTSFSTWSTFNLMPILMTALTSSLHSNVLLEWKYVRPATIRVKIDSPDFISIFTQIYSNMFRWSFGKLDRNTPGNSEKYYNDASVEMSGQSSYAAPSIQTFVQLLRYGVSGFHSVENSSIIGLLQSISSLNFAFQKNYNSSLVAWLSIFGLLLPFKVQSPLLSTLQLKKKQSVSNSSRCTELIDIANKPIVLVLLTLLIPKCVIMDKLNSIQCPIIEMSVRTNSTDDRFTSIQMQYVSERLFSAQSKSNMSGENALVYSNFNLLIGTSQNYKFLACTTLIPQSCLEGDDVEISLRVPYSVYLREPEMLSLFGMSGVVYSAAFNDKTKVSWSVYSPIKNEIDIKKTRGQCILCDTMDVLNETKWSPLNAVIKNGEITSYTCKIDLGETEYHRNGGMKNCVPILQYSTTLRAVLQLQQEHKIQAQLPVPTDMCRTTVQISRKKGFLNLIIPLFKEFSFLSLPMFRTSTHPSQFYFIGAPRCLLNCMPKINTNIKLSKSDWLSNLAGSQVGFDDRKGNLSGLSADNFSMKETIHAILLNFIGHNPHLRGKKSKLFALNSEKNGVEILIYVNAVRINFHDYSVLIDAAVCVLTNYPNNSTAVGKWCNEMNYKREICFTSVKSGEVVLWKKALPAMNERTRNNWKHTSTCQYVTSGTDSIPLSCNTNGHCVVCQCGQGKGLEGTEFEHDIKPSHPIYQHFFRAAISPFFSTLKCLHDHDKE